jgi:hypothetical protein
MAVITAYYTRFMGQSLPTLKRAKRQGRQPSTAARLVNPEQVKFPYRRKIFLFGRTITQVYSAITPVPDVEDTNPADNVMTVTGGAFAVCHVQLLEPLAVGFKLTYNGADNYSLSAELVAEDTEPGQIPITGDFTTDIENLVEFFNGTFDQDDIPVIMALDEFEEPFLKFTHQVNSALPNRNYNVVLSYGGDEWKFFFVGGQNPTGLPTE